MGARQSQSTKGGGNASLAALDRLGGEARELAQLAAVIGRSRRQPITLCYWRAAGNTIVTSLAPLEAMQSDAVEPEIIAQHYTAAELPEQAVPCSGRLRGSADREKTPGQRLIG